MAIAWTPRFWRTKNTVVPVRLRDQLQQQASMQRFATSLAFQQPFSVTQKNVAELEQDDHGLPSLANMDAGQRLQLRHTQTTRKLELRGGPNYRLGMVQVYNLGHLQRTLPQGVVLNIDYTGAYAGNLDMLRAPNRTPSGLIVQSVGQFTYEDSLGYQRSNALAVNARERMHKGVSLQATHTYSHSIDDASSVGGSGGSIAQNDQDLSAEEATPASTGGTS